MITEKLRLYKRKWNRAWKKRITPEQRRAINEKARIYMRKRRLKMTVEELEAQRLKARAYKRLWNKSAKGMACNLRSSKKRLTLSKKTGRCYKCREPAMVKPDGQSAFYCKKHLKMNADNTHLHFKRMGVHRARQYYRKSQKRFITQHPDYYRTPSYRKRCRIRYLERMARDPDYNRKKYLKYRKKIK